MKKFTIIATILTIILILDKMYLLPLSVPLDTLPDSKRSAAYLARTIAKEAKCNDILLGITYEEKETVLNMGCGIENKVFFDIHVFLTAKTRNAWFKTSSETDESTGYPIPCFKKGNAYLICEEVLDRDKKGKPIFHGQKYYKQFPGEDISYKDN